MYYTLGTFEICQSGIKVRCHSKKNSSEGSNFFFQLWASLEAFWGQKWHIRTKYHICRIQNILRANRYRIYRNKQSCLVPWCVSIQKFNYEHSPHYVNWDLLAHNLSGNGWAVWKYCQFKQPLNVLLFHLLLLWPQLKANDANTFCTLRNKKQIPCMVHCCHALMSCKFEAVTRKVVLFFLWKLILISREM